MVDFAPPPNVISHVTPMLYGVMTISTDCELGTFPRVPRQAANKIWAPYETVRNIKNWSTSLTTQEKGGLCEQRGLNLTHLSLHITFQLTHIITWRIYTLEAYQNVHGSPSFILEVHDFVFRLTCTKHEVHDMFLNLLVRLYIFRLSFDTLTCKVKISTMYYDIFYALYRTSFLPV
jgi:hypothetical protein